ncbi:beta-L-arabinofuranosidase domain-containing protein [Kribbella sp. CA-253562]|uniref:beta-L-arabinofuranosidase domain-containing protein n=1 Tax=Kribbella sp. CA-253562 TaxID=3239942 RepID=UPI003D90AD43
MWPRMVVLKALLQYHDATGDERIVPAALRFARLLTQLLDLAAVAHSQGYDWLEYAGHLPYRDKVPDAALHEFQRRTGVWMNDDYLATHGPNIAMGLKAAPEGWRTTGDDSYRTLLTRMLSQLDTYHGQASGLFSCDEHLAGRHPSQGSETCAVVEYLFSLEIALETWGHVEPIVERLERLAFNALPASVKPDEWAHQYVQQANQVVAHVTEDRLYTNNGPDANVFGLEPHFSCGTANRHQGWPKYAGVLRFQACSRPLCVEACTWCRRGGGSAVGTAAKSW